MRIAFFGSDCLFSDSVLNTLLNSSHQVVAVMLPARSNRANPWERPIEAMLPQDAQVRQYDTYTLTVVSPFVNRSIINTAWKYGTTLYAVRDLVSPETSGVLHMARVDVACVACFPRRIPPSLLHVPKRGFLNVHPSMLPEYRGPSPLFWQFHEGESRTGVSIHWMDANFDTGPLADQRLVPLPDGISEMDATALMARTGGRLLVEVLAHVATGEIPYRTQPAGGAYQPYPHEGDFVMTPEWSARRAYNFMRATAVWGMPFQFQVPGETLILSDAISWLPHETLAAPIVYHDDEVTIQFNPGTLRAHLAQ